ncbi:MAG TPA: glycoside hydrolase [Planctomycetota bacterium]|jgi:hypothetical protein
MRNAGLALVVWLSVAIVFAAENNLLVNGDFESDNGKTAGQSAAPSWSPFWSREKDGGASALDTVTKHGGSRALKITHTGEKDWSVSQIAQVAVAGGDIFALSAWVKCDDAHQIEISVITRRGDGQVSNWMYGAQRTSGTHDWQELRGRFIAPADCANIQFRLTGSGKCTAWFDDAKLVKQGNLSQYTGPLKGKMLNAGNAHIAMQIKAEDGTLSITDKRNNRAWEQKPLGEGLIVKKAEIQGNQARLTLTDLATDNDYDAHFDLSPDKPEITVTIDGKGPLKQSLSFPYPFVTTKGTLLIIPMNEGISYPVDDTSINPMHLIAYGGHGICMAWYGAVDPISGAGVMTILNTPDDARIEINRPMGGDLYVRPQWEASRGEFGYARKLTFCIFDKGGYVAEAKRYRQHAKETGLFKTLAQKKAENPNVDLLIGAPNIWNWDMPKVPLCEEMKALGFERVLWSSGGKAEELQAINKLGYLSSRYDIYQDAMDPAKFKELRGIHPDWTSEAWPKDLMRGRDGDWVRGWEVETKDGKMYPCGTLCDKLAPAYAEKRIGEELKSKPYLCRFIDTTTASPWRECYDPGHPMTRSESRHWKMELLKVVSDRFKLVTGCETGHDASVPFLHYYEGMMSLGPYRSHDSGRAMQKIIDPPEPQVAKFQVGHYYRLPLWELVYHDCAVAQWYWGDYNNKSPSVWDRRDLFNILYGTPPMYMFNKQSWAKDKQRFADSYRAICTTVRKLGYQEMLSHEFLTPDHAVQRTKWADGTEITVNFGEKAFPLPDGKEVKPMSSLVKPQ